MVNTRMYWVHAITPLHVGSGRGVGFIDLPIMREKVTSWPLVPGSAVKGVLREHFVRKNTDERLINAAFGKGGDDMGNAGALVLSDARIICLPVRSLYGTFAFATCPLVLERLKRDLDSAGHKSGPVEMSFEDDEVVVTAGSKVERKGNVLLEDLDFEIITDNGETNAWAELLARLLFPNDAAWQGIFKERFIILSNNCFNFISETGTEVNARIKIDQEKKIVVGGALWYEEALPSETILAGLAWCDRDYSNKGVTQEEIFNVFCKKEALNLQVGGKATVGKGRVRCLFTRSEGE
ncbi:MAG: type III-B CRISPR module RAMP protein Cmr4 [Methanotrichaceae archaeon]|nr:type III-B CRISPR module RAMP protein Cmr4 [Methanotrichaceae archaeon]